MNFFEHKLKRMSFTHNKRTLSPAIKFIFEVASKSNSCHILAHQFIAPTSKFFSVGADKF